MRRRERYREMVARSPPKQQRKMMVAPPPLSPTLLRETVKKVDMCMARLQELQYTVAGGTKMISGVRLSPNSTRTYLRTSLRCKHESLRIKNATGQRSPCGKLPTNDTDTEEWRRMSLPAMLLGETMGEILQASQFARNIVQSVSSNTRKPTTDDPTTPLTEKRRKQKQTETAQQQHSELHARRKMEKQTMWSKSDKPPSSIQRVKSRINFKASSSSPLHKRDCDKENCSYIANRISPRNRPWARKTVLFPNPLFHSSPPTSNHQKFSKTYTPVVTRNRQTPHKFLIKSPKAISPSKFQVKIKAPPVSISPTRAANLGKKSPKASLSAAAKLRRSFSPTRLANRLVSPLKNRNNVQKNEVSSSSAMTTAAAKLRRSFSPSRIANRLVSPLKSRKLLLVHNNNNNKNEGNIMSGLKQRPHVFVSSVLTSENLSVRA